MEVTKKTKRGRPRTRESLPPEDQKRTQAIYCSDREKEKVLQWLEQWRQAEKITAEDLIV